MVLEKFHESHIFIYVGKQKVDFKRCGHKNSFAEGMSSMAQTTFSVILLVLGLSGNWQLVNLY